MFIIHLMVVAIVIPSHYYATLPLDFDKAKRSLVELEKKFNDVVRSHWFNGSTSDILKFQEGITESKSELKKLTTVEKIQKFTQVVDILKDNVAKLKSRYIFDKIEGGFSIVTGIGALLPPPVGPVVGAVGSLVLLFIQILRPTFLV